MITKEKIARINELARLAKERELSPQEKEEQQALRKEYIQSFREAFKKQLEAIEVVD